MKRTNGFTLVEALLAMAIVLFVVVSILTGFTQQMVTNRYASNKNVAVSLAEARLEEYLKFPASHMPAGAVDYVVEEGRNLVVYASDPGKDDQYRRTVTVTPNAFGTMDVVNVTVEYGKKILMSLGYRHPFRVTLSSQRGG